MPCAHDSPRRDISRGKIISKTRLARTVAAMLSATWMLAVLVLVTLLAASSPAVESAPRAALRVSTQASVATAAEKRAPSPMLRESGYAIAKEKLD